MVLNGCGQWHRSHGLVLMVKNSVCVVVVVVSWVVVGGGEVKKFLLFDS